MAREKSVSELFDLSGRVALVTGGAGHLGSAMSRALAEAGATVAIASRNLAGCKKLAAAVEKSGGGAFAVKLDVTSDASAKRALAAVKKRAGRLDALVNNAYSGSEKPLGRATARDFTATLEAALTSAYRLTLAALPLLGKSPAASVINVSSMYALVSPDPAMYEGTPYFSPPGYGPGKAGMLQLTRYLAAYLAPRGVRVNAVSPGPFPPGTMAGSRKFLRRLEARCVLGRTGRPGEIKGAVLFLASDASSFVTGQNLVVDGGWTAR